MGFSFFIFSAKLSKCHAIFTVTSIHELPVPLTVTIKTIKFKWSLMENKVRIEQ